MKEPFIKSGILTAFLFIAGGPDSYSQGMINDGAKLILTPGAFIYISGGPGTGNFTNRDAGINTGTVINQGTMDVTGNWFNNSSFNCFSSNAGTVRLCGSDQSIGGTAPTWFNNLSLTGTGIKSLAINTLVGGGFAAPAGVFTINDRTLDLNMQRLIVNNGAPSAINYTTGYIISETALATNPSIVQWNMGTATGSHIFPFGRSGLQLPLAINKTTAGAADISVSTRATALPDNTSWASLVTNMNSGVIGGNGSIPVVIDRWYDISPSAPAIADITFTYRGTENTTTFAPAGIFGAQNWNGTAWLPPAGSGAGVTSGTGTVTAAAQNLSPSSTPWVLTNILAPLPVHLLNFSATCINSIALVNWTTATENNVFYYDVERSSNGYDYITLKRIYCTGNTASTKEYTTTDTNPLKGISYYRLKETDRNGAATLFDAVTFRSCDHLSSFAGVWNVSNQVYIQSFAPGFCHVNITLTDVHGKIISQWEKDFQKGANNFVLSAGGISDGIYFLNLLTPDFSLVSKLCITGEGINSAQIANINHKLTC